MYTFTQINHPPHWWVHKLGLLTVAGVIVLGSGCSYQLPDLYCPATGIGYTSKDLFHSKDCANNCKPIPSHHSFDREVPSQSVKKVHIFIDGNGYGKVTAQDSQSALLCESKDCGSIEGKISCKQETQCTQIVKTSTFTLLATEGNFSSFAGWEGDEDCHDGQLTMDTDKYCVAVFQSDETDCILGLIEGSMLDKKRVPPKSLSPFHEKVFDSRVLTPRRLQALTPAEIAALPLERLNSLETRQQIWALTTAQIPALTTAQIGALTTAQIGALSTTQIPALTTHQIQGLTTVQIGALTTDQIGALSKDQIGALSKDQKAALDARKKEFGIK